jgi:hypothetical protein
MQHGGQSRFTVRPADWKGGEWCLGAEWRAADGPLGDRSRPRLDHSLAKRTERHRFGSRNASILALDLAGLVKLCQLDPADGAQGLAKAL